MISQLIKTVSHFIFMKTIVTMNIMKRKHLTAYLFLFMLKKTLVYTNRMLMYNKTCVHVKQCQFEVFMRIKTEKIDFLVAMALKYYQNSSKYM